MSFQFLLVFFFIIVALLTSAFKRTKLVMRVLAFLRGLFVKMDALKWTHWHKLVSNWVGKVFRRGSSFLNFDPEGMLGEEKIGRDTLRLQTVAARRFDVQRPIHTRDFAPGACSRGAIAGEGQLLFLVNSEDDSEDDFHTSCRNVSHCQQRDSDHPADNHAQMTLGFKLRLDCQSLFGKRARAPPLEA